MKSENYLRFCAIVLFAHRRLIVRTIVVFVALAIMLIATTPPRYTLRGAILVKSKELPAQPEVARATGRERKTMPPAQEDVVLETRIVTDIGLIERAVRKLADRGIDVPPKPAGPVSQALTTLRKAMAGMVPTEKDSSTADTDPHHRTAMRIKSDLSASVYMASNIVDVVLTCHDPQTGRLLLDEILRQYPSFRLSLLADTTAYGFYFDQVDRYRSTLRESDDDVVALMRKHDVSEPGDELRGTIQLINQSSAESEQTREELRQSEHRKRYLRKVEDAYERYVQGEEVTLPPPVEFDEQSRGREVLPARLMEMYFEMRQYSGASAKSREIAGKIATELKNMVAWEQERADALGRLLQEKEARLSQLQQRAIRLREMHLKMKRIETDAELTRQQYETFATKLEEMKLELGTPTSQWASVQVLTRPRAPDGPSFPRPEIVLPVALITGVLLALALAWIAEFFDHTFKTPAQVQDILDLPVIGSVPFASTQTRPNTGRGKTR